MLQIYNKNGIFIDVILKKFTWKKSYGNFDSSIIGDVLFKDKSLDPKLLLGCYILYDNVKYTIVNAPTSESFMYLRENNNLNGNNRYQCEFFAPEYFLQEFEFVDVALTNNEQEYRTNQTSFFLCCNIDELIQRIQKNLNNRNIHLSGIEWEWHIYLQGKNYGTLQLNPIHFDKASIADVLKLIEDNYGLKYFVQSDKSIRANIIYIGDIVKSMPSSTFFDFGQDKGLTTSIRNSKKEGFVTKYYPRGSEHNVPFRYPLIKKHVTIQVPNSWDDVIINMNPRTSYFFIEIRMENPFQWDYIDMRTAKFDYPYPTNPDEDNYTFNYYDLDGDYARSFIEPNGTWNPNKSTRDLIKFPKGNITNPIVFTLFKTNDLSIISIFFPNRHKSPRIGERMLLRHSNEHFFGSFSLILIQNSYQGGYTNTSTYEIVEHSYYTLDNRIMPKFWVEAVKRRVLNNSDMPILEYLLAQQIPFPNATATTFTNYYDLKTPFIEHSDYDDVFPTIKEAIYNGIRIDKLIADSIGDSFRDYIFNNNYVGLQNSIQLVYPYFYISLDVIGYDWYWDREDIRRLSFSYTTDNGTIRTFSYYDLDGDYARSFIEPNGTWNPNKSTRDLIKFPKIQLSKIELTLTKIVQTMGIEYPFLTFIFPEDSELNTIKKYGVIRIMQGLNLFLNCRSNDKVYQRYSTSDFIDTIDRDSGELQQSTFFIKLNPLGFDLYAQAIENEEMYIHMTSGSCQGSRFRIAIEDWKDWCNNFYELKSENKWIFTGRRTLETHPQSNPTNFINYPDTTNIGQNIRVYKDIETWGKNFIMPTGDPLRIPNKEDTFVITGITLPDFYIEAAELKLQERALADLKDKNVEKFDYLFNLDNIHLEKNANLKQYLDTNIKIRFKYNNIEYESFFQSISIEFNLFSGVLPKYDVKLSDDVRRARIIGVEAFERESYGLADLISRMVNGYINDNNLSQVRIQQSIQNSLRNSNTNTNLILAANSDRISQELSRIDNELSNISNEIESLEIGKLIFTDENIIFDTITDIMELPIIRERYAIDIGNNDGIIINALGFYDSSGIIQPPYFGWKINVINIEIGKRYFLKINYGTGDICPSTTEYTLHFYINELHIILIINGNEFTPITRIVFWNNGLFTEAQVQYGIRLQGDCNVDNIITSDIQQL